MSLLNKSTITNQPKSVWAVFFASIIAFMGLGLVDPILPAISNQLGASPSQVTLLFTSYNAVMAIAMLVTGVISTRLGIKKTLLLGVVIIAAFSTLGGLSNNIWTIVGLRGFWGIGNALFVATALTAIVSLSKNGTSKSVILYEAAIGLGISVGPLLGGILGETSWRYPFIGVGVLMAVAFVFLITYMPESKEEQKQIPTTSLRDPFRAMKHRPIAVFGIAACLYNFGFFTLLAYAPFIMGLDAYGIGFVFVAWGILLAVTSIFMAPKLQEKFGTVKSMCIMLTAFAVVLLIMGVWTSTQWVVIACIIFSGALLGNNNTLITTAVMKAAPIERSTASAAYSFLRFIGSAIAPFTAGILAEIYSPHIPFLVGGCFVLGSVIFILLNRHHIIHVDKSEDIAMEKPEKRTLIVKDFMVSNLISVKLDSTILELLKLFTKYRIGGAPVLDSQKNLIGMVSDGDIIRYLAPKEGSVHDFIYEVLVEDEENEQDVLNERINATVEDVMEKKQIYTVKEEDTFERAIRILSHHHFKKLPVLDSNNKVIGIISRGDIDNNLMKILSNK
ncbi:major facilitator superfamily MFS_1 [Methanobacterium lacus]|uniref:Major facilitator superfamily MFS_1 n=1 Tax=Methanobacterium lacus (strain AL-21) TaxID=877455 RepID=F0TBW4_METLA|nr:MFS transporter [Methanobacterium lacus]ADZ10306.1 major facilitator superfamily MFS_1 [Methanobacterium lacus]